MTVRAATIADQARWDDYVATHPLGSPYHRYAWKQAMERAYSIETGYYLAENTRGGITGILPAARLPRPLGAGAWCSLPYCDRGEPLAGDRETAEALAARLVCGDDGRAGPTATYEIRATGSDDDQPGGDDAQLAPGQKVRLLLDLPDTPDALFEGFKSKHRSQINKARKNGLTISLGNAPAAVEQFYSVYSANMRNLGSPPHSRAWFHAVAGAYGDDCVIALVSTGASVIGAGLVLANPVQAAIPWASTLRDFNRLAPNMLLYWALLSHCIERGCRRFDFGRSGYGEGTYRFKAQWGARPVPLAWRRYRPAGTGQPSNLPAEGARQEASQDASRDPSKRTAHLRHWPRPPGAACRCR